jgi:uroporphyrinogen-III synthase
LGGRVIACLEARNANELADLVTRHGGIPYPAPCLREVHEPDAAETQRAVHLICGDEIDIVVFLTGVGVQTIVEGARHLDREANLLDGLLNKRVAVRGPKAQNAVWRVGARVDMVAPEPFTSIALLEVMARGWDLRGLTVLVQCYGAPATDFTTGLEKSLATVIEVYPYRWERPLDEDAVVRMIEDLDAGWIDVLAVTSAAQVEYLFAIAHDRGFRTELERALAMPHLRIAAQGSVCASAFQRRGIEVDLMAPRASMGAMVVEIARRVGPPPAAPSKDGPGAGSAVGLAFAGAVPPDDVRAIIRQLAANDTVVLLTGKARPADRLAEQYAVARGLAVHRVLPARNGLHPADGLVRRADRVVIVSADRSERAVDGLLRVAARYARPVRVVSTTSRDL